MSELHGPFAPVWMKKVRRAAGTWTWLPVAALLIVATLTFFWRLGEGSLHDWDEGLHAQMAQEMM